MFQPGLPSHAVCPAWMAPPFPLLGVGDHWGHWLGSYSPEGPWDTPPVSIHADLKARSNIHPPASPTQKHCGKTRGTPPARHLPCVLLRPRAEAHNQMPKTIHRLNYGRPHSPPHQTPASARLPETTRPSHGAAAWYRRPPPAIGSRVTPMCF